MERKLVRYLTTMKSYFGIGKALIVFSTFFYIFSFPAKATAQDLEFKIKAAYLYNFTKFITWPDIKSESFNICIVGKDPFGAILNSIENRESQGLPIRLYRYPTPTQVTHCHIIFLKFNGTLTGSTSAIMQSVNLPEHILTVSDQEDFVNQGGMIGFIIKDDKVRLQINLLQLKNKELKISAKLLEVAELIIGDKNESLHN